MEDVTRGRRKIREGVVVSNKMQKTVTVRVERRFRHAELDKVIKRGKKYYAHVDNMEIQEGQRVKIIETRPLSKLKRWRVLEICGEKS
jgi:small subunit ribosomal protein S17